MRMKISARALSVVYRPKVVSRDDDGTNVVLEHGIRARQLYKPPLEHAGRTATARDRIPICPPRTVIARRRNPVSPLYVVSAHLASRGTNRSISTLIAGALQKKHVLGSNPRGSRSEQ